MPKKTRKFSVLFAINILLAILLALSFLTPYVKPSRFPSLALFSLLVSPLIVVHCFFIVYWLLKFNSRIFLSLLLLGGSYFLHHKRTSTTAVLDQDKDLQELKLLSYNVRLLNHYEAQGPEEAIKLLQDLLISENPDVLCIQEFYKTPTLNLDAYPYKYEHFKGQHKMGHAIYAKYPILYKGAFDFKETSNNIIYADLKVGNDTLRVYNAHLQSFGVQAAVTTLQESAKNNLRARLSERFIAQENQMHALVNNLKTVKYKKVVCGDFNNTAYSYVYHQLSKHLTDSFLEEGSGLGTTFSFDFYPLRIDYIFVSESLKTLSFKTLKRTFSDHHPIQATIGW